MILAPRRHVIVERVGGEKQLFQVLEIQASRDLLLSHRNDD